jgi:hypothetical protein
MDTLHRIRQLREARRRHKRKHAINNNESVRCNAIGEPSNFFQDTDDRD